jgi:hypothetical protein
MRDSSSPPTEARADVVVDVVYEEGVFHLELVNLGSAPALHVSCRFEPPLTGPDGRPLAKLPLFRDVPFLMPGKRIRTLLDASAAWFAREEPTRVTAEVHWRERNGERRSQRVEHDLAIYRDVVHIA